MLDALLILLAAAVAYRTGHSVGFSRGHAEALDARAWLDRLRATPERETFFDYHR